MSIGSPTDLPGREAARDWPGNAANPYFTTSISLGRQLLSKNGSSGLYSRRMVNQPLSGIVWIQLPRFTPAGCFGPKGYQLESQHVGQEFLNDASEHFRVIHVRQMSCILHQHLSRRWDVFLHMVGGGQQIR